MANRTMKKRNGIQNGDGCGVGPMDVCGDCMGLGAMMNDENDQDGSDGIDGDKWFVGTLCS